ncbi:hypothetical protein D5H75_33320 [Bailinhaonella thermotolerans]|uniref:OmpR/PhoB-type domain-containing protein n=2 Tax=Bailinhaonella thermotolerans TaxID=1070861 RepID=A0A3A4AUQ3_9ACTN|nr:hypothetical protein D5H75_33320 [Bailinhaonella thermotolerans]
MKRSLLAALLIRRGRIVSTEDLVTELWHDSPPARVENALHAQVSRLRRIFCADGRVRLHTRYPGYRLDVPRGAVDVDRFRELRDRAERLKAGDPKTAADCYRESLKIWRGPALQDVPPGPIRDGESSRLTRERTLTLTRLVEIDLNLSRHQEIIPELEELVHEHPLEERLYAQLMVALDRAGRTADALEVYQSARLRLAVEAGLSPSPALERCMRSILRRMQAD